MCLDFESYSHLELGSGGQQGDLQKGHVGELPKNVITIINLSTVEIFAKKILEILLLTLAEIENTKILANQGN